MSVVPRLEREFLSDNLLVRIHFIIEMVWWTSLAPWDFEFPFSGSLTSAFLSPPVSSHLSIQECLNSQSKTRGVVQVSILAYHWSHSCAKLGQARGWSTLSWHKSFVRRCGFKTSHGRWWFQHSRVDVSVYLGSRSVWSGIFGGLTCWVRGANPSTLTNPSTLRIGPQRHPASLATSLTGETFSWGVRGLLEPLQVCLAHEKPPPPQSLE